MRNVLYVSGAMLTLEIALTKYFAEANEAIHDF